MKQTISNACGTIGALHAIGNVVQPSQLGMWYSLLYASEYDVSFLSWVCTVSCLLTTGNMCEAHASPVLHAMSGVMKPSKL